MEANNPKFDVAALKRNSEQEWTLFDNVTLEEMTIALPAGHFDYAVIYDKEKKKVGYWNSEKGVTLYPHKKKKKNKKAKTSLPGSKIQKNDKR